MNECMETEILSMKQFAADSSVHSGALPVLSSTKGCPVV